MAFCVACDAEFELDYVEEGEIVTCPECGVELRVISVDPTEFDFASELDDVEWEEEDE
jgi:alpha-aminoadipate carrier protein LysW